MKPLLFLFGLLFGANGIVCNPQDIGSSFNGVYAEKNLIKDGLFALEIGIGQKDLITDKIGVAFNNIEIVKDFSQRERFLFAYKN